MASTLKVNEIQHTGGTSAMTIDSSGRILQPAKPAFHTIGSGGWTTFSNGAWTKIEMTSPSLNIGSHYDSTNSKFIAPVAGVYHFYAKVYGRVQAGGNNTTYWNCRFQKNNGVISGHDSVIMGYYYADGGFDETAHLSINLQLAVNDEITVHAKSAGSYNGEYYKAQNEFGGHLIG